MDDIAFVRRRLTAEVAKARVERDDIAALTAGLAALRATPEYEAALDEPEPLVSVRIATYRRTEELMDIALASVWPMISSFRRPPRATRSSTCSAALPPCSWCGRT